MIKKRSLLQIPYARCDHGILSNEHTSLVFGQRVGSLLPLFNIVVIYISSGSHNVVKQKRGVHIGLSVRDEPPPMTVFPGYGRVDNAFQFVFFLIHHHLGSWQSLGIGSHHSHDTPDSGHLLSWQMFLSIFITQKRQKLARFLRCYFTGPISLAGSKYSNSTDSPFHLKRIMGVKVAERLLETPVIPPRT